MYSTVPITATYTDVTFVVITFVSMFCMLGFITAHLLTKNKISDYMLYCFWVSIGVIVVSVGTDIYKSGQAKTILVPQHNVTAKLIDVATDSVKSGKYSTSTISVAVYEVENGDVVTFPVKFGDPIVKNAILYVKDKQ